MAALNDIQGVVIARLQTIAKDAIKPYHLTTTYGYDFGSINERDSNLKTAPWAVLTYGNESIVDEQNSYYGNCVIDLQMTISVVPASISFDSHDDLDSTLWDVIEDIKRLFIGAKTEQDLDSLAVITYNGMSRKFTSDIPEPGIAILNWKINYSPMRY
jgi:hypothetical protein